MNLINDPWIAIRRKSGRREQIAPWQVTETDDPIIALDTPRPDFNGALMQFLIGLMQTTVTPETHDKWLDWLLEPPTPLELKSHFDKYLDTFELNSDKGSFMQDFETLDGAPKEIAALLIESPGDNAKKENKDHFVKRGQVKSTCPSCTVTALYSLQTNAPSGGQGHRTSLRGGGPLTTLVVLDDKQAAGIDENDIPNDLWRSLWLNVLDRLGLDTIPGDSGKSERTDIFPWMAETRTSEKGSGKETTPVDAHPLQVYWGMPRRIKIQWDSGGSGRCDMCNAESNNLVANYLSKNLGVNYTGAWQHPLSPYSLNKDGELLPRHAQPGGMNYRHWLGLTDNTETQFNALVVRRYQNLAEAWGDQVRLSVFGYDMDNMKARCWYETTFPLYTVPESIREDFSKRVQILTEASSDFAGFVRSCVKEAWFNRPGDAKGDTTFLVQAFFQQTEDAFYQSLIALQSKLADGSSKEVLHAWHNTLRKSAYELFDYWASSGDIAQANPRRIAQARHKLTGLMFSNKIRAALQLPSKSKKELA